MSESMELFMWGFLTGALLMVVYFAVQLGVQERRHRDRVAILRRSFDPELQNLPTPASPAEVDGVDDGYNTQWIKHTQYHWTCNLNGQTLQYWPTQSKWCWQGRTYCGDVEAFIQEELDRDYD